MEHKINDGTGTGYSLKIDNNNRAWTDSVVRTQKQEAALNGVGYNLSTGSIVLTTAGNSAVFYLKSNEINPVVIDRLLVILGNSTGGSGSGTITITRNPIAGTIVSGASPIAIQSNNDFGSTNTLNATIYKGATGDTITGGETRAITTRSTFIEPVEFVNQIILRRGSSVAVSYQPPAGNTSQNIIIVADCFIENSDV